ncbi:hypothetical protein PTW35_09155 [Photobacterium sp. DA100]|uniref:mobilome CxxCx(11)CxxC protein n=1 Tax=Photobacterium sp. DA100 TaxID=3027472 RepID=UPI002478ACE8|nr:mobilome CxxCx(11)CxxC protein [Photobacterium sp. DA100]WEM40819.1 hypothetical protein PTW35_09155 [Photobacterium sp. DA100]
MPIHLMEMRFHTYGAIEIFEKRKRRLCRLRNVIVYLGLAIPVSLLCLVLFDNEHPAIKSTLIAIISIILLVQLIMSLWALIAKWEEKYEYSISAMTSSRIIYERLNSLINSNKSIPSDVMLAISDDYHSQFSDELAHEITAKEKCYGYRKSLIKFSKVCPLCQSKPIDMKPSGCKLCGKF